MNRQTERLYPICFAAVFSALYLLLQHKVILPDKLLSDLVSASLITSATLLGFFLTISTILNTVNTRRMRFVKEQGVYPQFLMYQNTAIWLNVIIVSLSIVYPFITSIHALNDFYTLINTSVIFLITWSWMSSIRFMYLFLKIIRDPE